MTYAIQQLQRRGLVSTGSGSGATAVGNTYGLLYAKVLTTSGSLSGTGISFGGRCWAAGAVLVGK